MGFIIITRRIFSVSMMSGFYQYLIQINLYYYHIQCVINFEKILKINLQQLSNCIDFDFVYS